MRKIDGKFSIQGEQIVNTVTGVSIPDDEPLFLLRGRDRNARQLLRDYYAICEDDGCNALHLDGISQTIGKFEKFANNNPDLLKQPGITKHLRLESE